MKLSSDEIKQYLSVNQNNQKRDMLHKLSDLLAVNELLTEDDIESIKQDSLLYDSLHNIDCRFDCLLDDYYMSHLDVPYNNKTVMCWLHAIYS